jgi:hypothetical protein
MKTGATLIAPCGMNCGVCLAYLRQKRHCSGCRGGDADKPISILRCTARNCTINNTNRSGFCWECAKYPCPRLKQLDKRYRTKYMMSMRENLEYLKVHGLAAFTEKEDERWRCRKCGGVICVHRRGCYQCEEKPALDKHGLLPDKRTSKVPASPPAP